MSDPNPTLQSGNVSPNGTSGNVSNSDASPTGASNLAPSSPGTSQPPTGAAGVRQNESVSANGDQENLSNSRGTKRQRPSSSDAPSAYSPSPSGRQLTSTSAENEARQHADLPTILLSNLQPAAARSELEGNVNASVNPPARSPGALPSTPPTAHISQATAVPRSGGNGKVKSGTSNASPGSSHGVHQQPSKHAFMVSIKRESDLGKMIDMGNTIREQEKELEGRDGQIADLTMDMAELNQKLQDRDNDIKHYKKQIEDLTTEVERLEGVISRQAKVLAQ